MKNEANPRVYGIGNPLMDIIVSAKDQELVQLGVNKGTMTLTDAYRHEQLLEFASKRNPSYSAGGSCPNTIATLAAMGIDATLAGKIGFDQQGDMYSSLMEQKRVRNELVRSIDQHTGASVILVTEDSERSMNTYLGANRQYSKEDVNDESVIQADFFHFTGYMWDTESQKQAIKHTLSLAKQAHTAVSFDIADPMAVKRYHDDFMELIRSCCDIVYANREEAHILFGNEDPVENCKQLGKFCSTAIVKNGKKGSYICHNGNLLTIPVKGSVHPVDTTGAGDTYASGYLYGLCTHHSIAESGMIASFLAGEIISQWGAQFSPERARFLKRMLETGSWSL